LANSPLTWDSRHSAFASPITIESTQLHLERNRKSRGILHDFLDLFSNTRDSHALCWACEPDAVMKEKDNTDQEPGVFESLRQLQQCYLKHVNLQHLKHGILCLPFLPVSQLALVVEAAPAASQGSHASNLGGHVLMRLGNAVEIPGYAAINGRQFSHDSVR